MQLSPHNAWKAVDVLKELQEESSKATRESDIEVVEKDVCCNTCGYYVRNHPIPGGCTAPSVPHEIKEIIQALRNLDKL